MLQCTAVTYTPITEAVIALTTLEGEPVHPEDVLLEEFVLCELPEHDETAEHAAQLYVGETREDQDLWLFWTGTDAHRIYRLEALAMCPARLHDRHTGLTRRCIFFYNHRPRDHSFFVTDPLRQALAEEIRAGLRDHAEDRTNDTDDI
ncbi:hypothetical protein [Streptomyces microflavus]|uniref:hypothetical protein n=1 Tax=Streptomyces microflavus TaxID=1919 RepID=UPI0033BFCF49